MPISNAGRGSIPDGDTYSSDGTGARMSPLAQVIARLPGSLEAAERSLSGHACHARISIGGCRQPLNYCPFGWVPGRHRFNRSEKSKYKNRKKPLCRRRSIHSFRRSGRNPVPTRGTWILRRSFISPPQTKRGVRACLVFLKVGCMPNSLDRRDGKRTI
jgi:hypothetical protein